MCSFASVFRFLKVSPTLEHFFTPPSGTDSYEFGESNQRKRISMCRRMHYKDYEGAAKAANAAEWNGQSAALNRASHPV